MSSIENRKRAAVTLALQNSDVWQRVKRDADNATAPAIAQWITANFNLKRTVKKTTDRVQTLLLMEFPAFALVIKHRDIEKLVKRGYEALQ